MHCTAISPTLLSPSVWNKMILFTNIHIYILIDGCEFYSLCIWYILVYSGLWPSYLNQLLISYAFQTVFKQLKYINISLFYFLNTLHWFAWNCIHNKVEYECIHQFYHFWRSVLSWSVFSSHSEVMCISEHPLSISSSSSVDTKGCEKKNNILKYWYCINIINLRIYTFSHCSKVWDQ